MKGRLFTRVFDHHTFACYFAAIALMLFLVGGHRSPLLFFMGFSAQDGAGGLDIMRTMEWNLCVLPPVSASILFLMPELGALSTYTIVRSKNIRRWWLMRLAAVVVINYVFFLFALGPTVPHFWRRAVVGRMVHSCGSVSTAHYTSLIPLCWRYDPVYQPSNHHLLSFGRVWSVSSRNGLPTSQLISSTLLGHGAGNGRQLQFCGGGQCVSVDRAEPWHYILAESA